MSSPTRKPERPKDCRETTPKAVPGDTATVEVVPNSFGTVLPGGDWWVNEPTWEQAVRRLTAPPLPPSAATAPSMSQNPAPSNDAPHSPTEQS